MSETYSHFLDVMALHLRTKSPFAGQLGTSFIPSREQVEEIRCVMARPEADLIALDAKLAHLRTMQGELSLVPHTELWLLRNEVANKLNAHRALISPARRTPPEIWAHVFSFCISGSNQFLEPDMNQPPLLLCRVCSSWRQIAISTPQLWCSLSVQIRKDVLDSQLSWMQAWLSRSGVLPLSIQILDSRCIPKDNAVNAIIPYSHRWQHLWLDISFSSMKRVLGNPNVSMPLLESIAIYIPIRNVQPFVISPSATHLHSVTILSSTIESHVFNLAWGQLTSLSLSPAKSTLGLDGCFHILRQCPKLQSFRVRIHFYAIPLTFSPNPILLRDLHTLWISTYQESRHFLNGLVLPSLREITINMSRWTSLDTSSVLSLISRSACRPRRLELNETPLSELQLTQLVRNIPTLLDLVATRYDHSTSSRYSIVTGHIAYMLSMRKLSEGALGA